MPVSFTKNATPAHEDEHDQDLAPGPGRGEGTGERLDPEPRPQGDREAEQGNHRERRVEHLPEAAGETVADLGQTGGQARAGLLDEPRRVRRRRRQEAAHHEHDREAGDGHGQRHADLPKPEAPARPELPPEAGRGEQHDRARRRRRPGSGSRPAGRTRTAGPRLGRGRSGPRRTDLRRAAWTRTRSAGRSSASRRTSCPRAGGCGAPREPRARSTARKTRIDGAHEDERRHRTAPRDEPRRRGEQDRPDDDPRHRPGIGEAGQQSRRPPRGS